MFEGLDTVVLQNELAMEDELPFAWFPSPLPLSPSVLARNLETNARILQVCMALDDQAQVDKADDQPQAAELARLDLKMNLLLDLVGRLLIQNQPRPALNRLRFNARGALWRADGVAPSGKTGETGIFEVYLHNCLVDPLRLTGRISQSDREAVEVQFDRSPDTIANLIDKLTFRRHRRSIVKARHPKRT